MVTSKSTCSYSLLFSALLVSGDVATSWLTVEARDVPYASKLASGDSSVCRLRRHREPAWVKLRQTSLLWCNFPCLQLQNVKWSKNREERVQQSCPQTLVLQLAWFPEIAYLNFSMIIIVNFCSLSQGAWICELEACANKWDLQWGFFCLLVFFLFLKAVFFC